MKKNFVVKSTIEIECSGRIYDLHNDFDCSRILFDPISSSLALSWTSSASGMLVQISFESIELLMLRGMDTEVPREEDRRLSFLGYTHPEDTDLMNGFLPEDLAGDDYHFILGFEGGVTIKLHCRSARFGEGHPDSPPGYV